MKNAFDVFISYRRENGGQMAQLLHIALSARGYAPFMDVRDLGSGAFDEALERHIQAAEDFVVVLAPGSLDRCRDSADWLRREIALALASNLNIVPLLLDGFVMPSASEVPDDIAPLVMRHAVSYSHENATACLDRMISMLKSKPRVELEKVAYWLAPHAGWIASILAWSTRFKDNPYVTPNNATLGASHIIARFAELMKKQYGAAGTVIKRLEFNESSVQYFLFELWHHVSNTSLSEPMDNIVPLAITPEMVESLAHCFGRQLFDNLVLLRDSGQSPATPAAWEAYVKEKERNDALRRQPQSRSP
ncbi:MAG: toll/interleukin-1 receptor domain-containing protein [Planctomycetia bacterium]|nr:toll/interleukin-1 receptor domain-containing protein [Planctomycetia bacterium]